MISDLEENKPSMIEHDTVVDLLRITMLVYNYGKNIVMEDEDQTVETFVSKIRAAGTLEGLDVSCARKEALIEIAEHAPSGKVHKFISEPSTDLQVGITTNDEDKRICVVFRGSESKSDWYYDLQVRKRHLHDGIYVHGGFYDQLHGNDVCKKIVDEIKQLIDAKPDYQIYITGHSLGAALSTLFGFLLSEELENKITVVSFASPRVGNLEWRNAFEAKPNLIHYRIANDRDVVTAFPMYKYKHVGENIRLFENKFDVFSNYSYNTWYDYSLFRCWSMGDHDCDLYYKRLLKNKW